MFFSIYILMMFIACSGYTGALNSLIAVPVQPKIMKTLKEVAESNMPVYQLDFMIPIMEKVYVHEDIKEILKTIKPYIDYDTTFAMVRQGKAQMFSSEVKFHYHHQQTKQNE